MGDSSGFQQIVLGGIGPVLQFCMFCISWAGEIYSFSGGVKCKLVSRLLEKCKLTWADRGFWGSEFCIWMRYEGYKLLTSCRGLWNLNAEDPIMQYDGNDVNLRRDLYLTRSLWKSFTNSTNLSECLDYLQSLPWNFPTPNNKVALKKGPSGINYVPMCINKL